jgi:cobalt-zinc-cadmium resistance protein CzcA
MKKMIAFSIQHPWSSLVFYLVLVLAGLWCATQLPLDAVPDVTNNQVQINSPVEGLAPEQIEQQVTLPVEIALSGLPGSLQVRSITRAGLSQVTVVFKDGMDRYFCRQLVAERIQGLSSSLPPGVVPQLGPITTGLGEIFFYTLEAKEVAKGEARARQLMDLRDIQDWVVKPRLITVPGVAEVNSSGGYERQALVHPNPVQMAQRGLHLENLVEALQRANRNAGGGIIEQGGEQFSVSAMGALADLEAIRKVPIQSDQSLATVRVEDVAKVEWGKALRNGSGTRNGRESLVGSVLMLAGANSRVVANSVSERLDEISKNMPDWVTVKVLYSRTDLVQATLKTVGHNLLFGALLVVLILVLLLGNMRAAIITAVTIPLSMLAAIIIMLPMGISGNLMSLGAIDFGILVDGAVIVMDQCIRYVSQRREKAGRSLSRHEVRAAILDAVVDVRGAAGFGQLIIVVAMLPLFGLTGMEGKTFIPMAATLCLALGSAFFISFTAVPAMACLLLTGHTKDAEPWLMRLAHRLYAPVIQKALAIPKTLLVAGVMLLALSFFIYTRLGAVFMPQMNEGSLLAQFVRPVTCSLSESVHMQEMSESLILEFGEVQEVFSRLGTPEIATDPVGVNHSDLFIMLKNRKQWPKLPDGSTRDKAALAEAITKKLKEELPGQRLMMLQPIQVRINELLEGTRSDIAVKIFGEDLALISSLANQVAEEIRQVRGAGDVELELRGTTPILSVLPKKNVLASMGLSSAEILDSIEIGLAGQETGSIYEGFRRYPLVVRLEDSVRQDLDSLKNLPVGIGNAATRPLRDLADLQYVESYPTFNREQTKRRGAVLVNPKGRDTESFVLEAQKRIKEKIKMPEGYYMEWGGTFQNLRVARERLLILTPLALALVLVMVYAVFGNAMLSLLVFAGVPFALVGGVLALFARQMPFSISAGVGFIALAGIAVLNGLVLVSTSVSLRRNGMESVKAIRTAAESRLRPVLMTAMVEVFGFLPMMFSTGLGAEVQQPLATVVVGGVISSTLLTLLMLPSWQTWLEKKKFVSKDQLSDEELEKHLQSHP